MTPATQRARRISVDEQCIELAKHFLATVEGAGQDDVADLAEAIQSTCEDHCRAIERERP